MRTPAFILPLIVVTIALAGCTSNGGRPQQAIRLEGGLDASESARPRLGAAIVLLKGCLEILKPNVDHVNLFRVDDRTQEFSDGVFDGNVEAAMESIVAEVKKPSGHGGTYSALFWTAMAERSEADNARTIIVLATDGDNDDMSEAAEKALRSAVVRLARRPNVRAVVLYGLDKSNMAKLRSEFAPLKDRFYPIMSSELRTETVLPLLEKARQ